MKKLLILALASAVAAASNAADWFSVAVSGSTQKTTGASWSPTPAAADVANGVISIDADEEIILSPTATKPSPEVKTVVEVQAAFTAASDYSSLEQLDDAKTALTVAKDGDTLKYYYWDSAESDPNVNKWKAITGLTPTLSETPVTVTFELDNSSTAATTAKITIGGQTVTVGLDADTSLSALAFAGTGTLTSVAATVTPAYATTATKRYASVSAALDDSVAVNAMTLRKHNGAFGEMPTPANDKVYYVKNASGTTADLGVFPASGEDGTAAKPYKIGSVEELKAFQQYVAAGFTTQGNTFTQTVDIVLNEAWPGIGIQNGKDIAGTADFDNGAFKGTYDGGNHTISGFQMVGVAGNPANEGKEQSKWEGLDYCGFFNSTYNATIKNLKIEYKGSLFATDTTASTKESGATFVGVAKNSTLRNLTSLAGTVSCSKGFGGIVGYLMGTTVDSCTNNLNMTSLANNKCGGIAMICQQENCSISNCKNTGTMTTGSGEFGGIIGYTDTITISDCENTAACKMFHHHGGIVTLSGTNTGNATVASYTGNATPGLNFATVSGNVATFVADNALAAGNTYKVMATGATATYSFTAAGTIAFDTALLATPPTYAITAGNGLVLTDSTEGTVKTYKAAVQTFTITWKSDANTTIDTTTVDYGELPSHEDPTKVGYEFTGWDSEIVAATADATYTAKWKQIAIPVVVKTATTLVSVPKDCNVSELINTKNRDKDDLLRVLNKRTNNYYQWSYDGNGGWTRNNVATVGDNIDETPEADTVNLVRGEAVWVTRKDASKEILLNAVYTDDPVTVEVIKGYNLVAPVPKDSAETVVIDEVVADDSTGKDRVFIPAEGKAPYNLDFKDGNWGYDKYTIEEGQLKKDRVTDVAIPAGTGFFYINNGDGKKDITLGGAN